MEVILHQGASLQRHTVVMDRVAHTADLRHSYFLSTKLISSTSLPPLLTLTRKICLAVDGKIRHKAQEPHFCTMARYPELLGYLGRADALQKPRRERV